MDRRRFLRAGMAACLAPGATALTQCAPRRPATRTDADWADLASQLSGGLLRPGDAQFDQLGMPLNRQFGTVRPAAVAVCRTAEDVSSALKWSREHGVPVVPRSGGHSYMGYSTNDGVVISVRGMNSVRYHNDSDTVVAGGGARNQDVAAALKPVNMTIPGGQCPTVGVAGLTLGGGLGFSARSFGMTSDSLLSTRVVLAGGDIVTASATENPELFWALRGGGGGNFGINTEFTYAARPARNCTHFSLDFPAGRAADVLDAWFTVLADAPRELGMVWYHLPGATPADTPSCGTWGQMYGTAAQTREALAPVAAAGGPPILAEFIEGTYWEAADYLAENDPTPHGFLCRSRFLDRRLGADGIAALTAQLDRQPRNRGATSIFAWGGAISDTPPAATAFVHRSDTALISYGPQWLPDETETREASSRWLNETFEVMAPYSSSRSFQNFPDGELAGWERAYYGANLERLIAVKQKYDPDRRFAFPQAIPHS